MKIFKTFLLVSTFVAGGAIAAAAQTGSPPGATGAGSGEISAATHCKDASGQVKLKSAMSGSGAGAAGSAAGGGSADSSPSGTTTGSAGMSGSGSAGAGSAGAAGSASGSAAANLPNC